jgi:hypothetical protein
MKEISSNWLITEGEECYDVTHIPCVPVPRHGSFIAQTASVRRDMVWQQLSSDRD